MSVALRELSMPRALYRPLQDKDPPRRSAPLTRCQANFVYDAQLPTWSTNGSGLAGPNGQVIDDSRHTLCLTREVKSTPVLRFVDHRPRQRHTTVVCCHPDA